MRCPSCGGQGEALELVLTSDAPWLLVSSAPQLALKEQLQPHSSEYSSTEGPSWCGWLLSSPTSQSGNFHSEQHSQDGELQGLAELFLVFQCAGC